jgi:hypothetical protein
MVLTPLFMNFNVLIDRLHVVENIIRTSRALTLKIRIAVKENSSAKDLSKKERTPRDMRILHQHARGVLRYLMELSDE